MEQSKTPTSITKEQVDDLKLFIDNALAAFGDYEEIKVNLFAAPELINSALNKMRNEYFLLAGYVLHRHEAILEVLREHVKE